jgi:hypothetical protein
MPLKTLNRKNLRNILLTNWMTHDALWYGELALRFGMAEASPMNLRVCRKLGRIEFGRLIKEAGASHPRDMVEYREIFELGKQVFFPDFMSVETLYPEKDTQIFQVIDCFAHRGMEKAGFIADYECGIFERIEGWFDAMGLEYTRTPDLSRCLKFRGEDCTVTIKFNFE